MSTRTSTVHLTMPAKAEYLILARLALAGIARQAPIGESALADLKLAVTEVCGNAVRHAYPSGDGAVRIAFLVGPEAIEVTVSDDGGGIALDGARDDLRLSDDLPESGMGFAIIRAVVDELEVDVQPGRGAVVKISKRLAS